MDQVNHRLRLEEFGTEAICARIIARHPDSISVQKPRLAISNLSKIIQAILKLSNRQGFHATSLRDLAKESGLSMGGLYSYFENKNTLLDMILGEVSEAVSGVLRACPPELTPPEKLRWLIDAHVRLTETMQPWFVFAYMEAKSFPAAARRKAVESEAATEAVFAGVLAEGVEQGLFAIDDVELTASLIKPLLQDWYVKRSKYRKRGVSIDSYVETVTKLLERAIAG